MIALFYIVDSSSLVIRDVSRLMPCSLVLLLVVLKTIRYTTNRR
uniref:Uncharacterized protein n=1 Tax=Heterorhabditis bacteriophora TaxID=37862 RepID=A0A1I7WDF6_HETBA